MKKKILIISSIFIILDQILKLVIRSNIPLGKEIFIIPNFFYLTNLKNTGGAFSILNNNTILLTIIGICVLGLLFYFLKNKKTNLLEDISYGLLIGGIIGNLIDRIIFGFVTDYIGFIIINYNYPVFNLADIIIVVSIFLLIILEFRGDINGSRSN